MYRLKSLTEIDCRCRKRLQGRIYCKSVCLDIGKRKENFNGWIKSNPYR